MWFNFIAILISIGSAVGTFLVLQNAGVTMWPCDGLKIALWLVFAMHMTNVFEFLFNLTGCEKKLCTGNMMCCYFVFEIVVLVYMQVVYFEKKICVEIM